jgi:two-component system OmpR family response regulator
MTLGVIVEDETCLRKDLADFLNLVGLTAVGVATAKAMRQALAEGPPPAIIMLDVGLPDGNGFDLAAEIRARHDCGIIMLTALSDSDDRIRGFESGADIYLVKHSTLREIEAAVRSLLWRTGDRSGPAMSQWVLDTTNWTLIAPNHRSLNLTATEFAFMNFLCSHCGEVCPRDELLATVGRPRSNFDNSHLDAVVSRLRRKLEESVNLPAPIKAVYGVGYTFTAPVSLR